MPYQTEDRCMSHKQSIEHAINRSVRYLEIEALPVLQKTRLYWLNNDSNLLGEKLARQHEQKKRWNISVK